MTVLDTNVWVALFSDRDSQHERAQTVVSALQKPLLLHEYVFIETCTVLQRVASHETATQFAREVLDNRDVYPLIVGWERLTRCTEQFIAEGRRALSFIDCALITLSQEYEILTFDNTLARAIRRRRGVRRH